jgi:hypothetical protein
MADLQPKTFDELSQMQQNAIQANATINLKKTLNFTEGALLLAAVESNNGVAMWLQGVGTKLLAMSRLQTSKNEDVDSFVEQFDFTRLPSTFATGLVVFSRTSAVNSATIGIGQQVSSSFTDISITGKLTLSNHTAIDSKFRLGAIDVVAIGTELLPAAS